MTVPTISSLAGLGLFSLEFQRQLCLGLAAPGALLHHLRSHTVLQAVLEPASLAVGLELLSRVATANELGGNLAVDGQAIVLGDGFHDGPGEEDAAVDAGAPTKVGVAGAEVLVGADGTLSHGADLLLS